MIKVTNFLEGKKCLAGHQKLQLLKLDFSNQKQLFIPPKSCKKP